jgi:hypothetical protein
MISYARAGQRRPRCGKGSGTRYVLLQLEHFAGCVLHGKHGGAACFGRRTKGPEGHVIVVSCRRGCLARQGLPYAPDERWATYGELDAIRERERATADSRLRLGLPAAAIGPSHSHKLTRSDGA